MTFDETPPDSGHDGLTLMSEEEVLRSRLAVLKDEHRDLDDAIDAMELRPARDQLSIRRLKKRKLALKDEISRIEDRLFPDIIA